MNFQFKFSDHDYNLLSRLREMRQKLRNSEKSEWHLGERVADSVAATVGSWHFIIIQSVLLGLWICANIFGWVAKPWDPYPFILLNLALSFQAAYTAPILMMSQNRQSDIDRKNASLDYDINIKAELEVELLHQKIDALTSLVQELMAK